MKAAQKFIHPILGIRELRLSEKAARGYGWAPYEEPKVIVTDDEPAKYEKASDNSEMYPKPTQPQAPESPKPTEPTAAPVTTQKAKPGRKPKPESAPKKQTRKPKAE